jgi:integrase
MSEKRTKSAKKPFGQKKPFTPKQVRILKEILLNKDELRDLVLCSVGIDTFLRASDLLKLTVEDVLNNKGSVKDEIILRQKKTGEAHTVAILDEAKGYVLQLIKKQSLYEDDYLFIGGRDKNKHLTVRHARNLVKKWAVYLGLNPKEFGSHSLRRTKATYIYKKTNNIEVVRLLLGQKSISSTSAYLNIEKQEALDIGREWVI